MTLLHFIFWMHNISACVSRFYELYESMHECIHIPNALTVEIIMRCLNVLWPLKRITVRKNQPNWFDGELKTVFCRKTACYKKACVSGLQQDWDDYIEVKRRARRLLISKKRGYITRQLNENRTAPTKFWKEIQNNFFLVNVKKKIGR